MFSRQSLPFCARCHIVGNVTTTQELFDFIQEHGVVGFVPADNPVIPVVIPEQRDYIEVALETV